MALLFSRHINLIIFMATKTFKEQAIRVIAVIGLIAVLVLGAWGIIQLAFAIPSLFSGIGSRTPAANKETLTISVPLSVTAGAAFPVAWSHKNFSGEYSYKLSYSCAEGVSMQAFVPTGETRDVACNTPFNFVNAASSTGLVAKLSGSNPTPVAIKVEATKLSTGAITATATANTTVAPQKTETKKPSTGGSSSTAKKPSSSSSSYVPAARPAQLYGYADLAVKVISYPTTVYPGQQVALKFEVENKGTNVSVANWTFSANLPYNPVYQYQSPAQQALYPGDRIVYTLTYDVAYNVSGTQQATIFVDPFNFVLETNESNNHASASYAVYGGYNQGGSYNNPWSYPYGSLPTYDQQPYDQGYYNWGNYYQNY